jgi:hypothetical protein
MIGFLIEFVIRLIYQCAVVRGVALSCDECAQQFVENDGCSMFPLNDSSVEEQHLAKYTSRNCAYRVDCLTTIESACKETCNAVEVPYCNYDSCCSGIPMALCYTMECMGDHHFCCGLWAETETSVLGVGGEHFFRRSEPCKSTPASIPSADPASFVALTREPTSPEIFTDVPTETPTQMPSSSPTETPTNQPTHVPTDTPTEMPTSSPTNTPTNQPTHMPTHMPTYVPTSNPTEIPTSTPTHMPTHVPTSLPSYLPTATPSERPTVAPTVIPSQIPTASPTALPTEMPSNFPTNIPTVSPTEKPTGSPTDVPTDKPTQVPTVDPTKIPTWFPTDYPTDDPTEAPTSSPTNIPTNLPTSMPSQMPTFMPTSNPTNLPTLSPTASPTAVPTEMPSSFPTNIPTVSPTEKPTGSPTDVPTDKPTHVPTVDPTKIPTWFPTDYPTDDPTEAPTSSPTNIPTNLPTSMPSQMPTYMPTSNPTNLPTLLPSEKPTASPTRAPTEFPTHRPTKVPTICRRQKKWTQELSNEVCPNQKNHVFTVKLCKKWRNPDYTRRLQFGLANNLYLDCSHKCVYDYRSLNDDVHLAFEWNGWCYKLNIGGGVCIKNEAVAMATVHSRALILCPDDEDTCLERIQWTPEVADANCPSGYGPNDHLYKGYGAKICYSTIRQEDGKWVKVQEKYSSSFNMSLANFIYWSCNSRCVYDIVFPGVVYQWRYKKRCWEMQTKWYCIDTERQQYAWSLEYVTNQVCYEPTPTPEPFKQIERVKEWNEEIALETCSYADMGKTNKGSKATVCQGKEDWQYRLDRSLANKMFLSCDAWCVYDIFTGAKEAFEWKNGKKQQCWLPVTKDFCFVDKKADQETMQHYIENILAESESPEPTYQPTCTPQREWSEKLMDRLCTVVATKATYKHHESVSRRPVPCKGSEDREADLLKSLAMQMYRQCSDWCVYDYYSNAIEAWKWSGKNLCWQLTRKGICFWKSGASNPDWDYAKGRMKYMCTYSPTMAPTDCLPYYAWNQERAEDLCPNESYGKANKSYGVSVCEDRKSVTRQTQLEKSLANKFYRGCTAWCVYDYDTLINNVQKDLTDRGGFKWRKTCWRWVDDDYLCFEKDDNLRLTGLFASETCAAKNFR